MSTTEKIAIVTGAGSGIGRAVALEFLSNGYLVALAGRREEALTETISLSGIYGNNATAVSTDVSDPNAVRALFAGVKQKYGRLDVLFNNAGMNAPPVKLEDLSDEQWTTIVNINFNGMFYCIREAFKVMKDQEPMGGRIINNGSISAHAPRPNSIPYTATKHAVTGLTKSASLDGRKYDIACSQIDIGNAMTELAAKMASGVPQADGTIKAESMMNVREVATAALYMANLPLDTNVQFMTIMATKMPFVGRG
ncbi:MAG: SDR family oxidoreductase [Burkholderiales bacterium]|jgi:NAD(P)-dependent dehydrogenase (short-subunit alcohol dehydrogenase family)|nr:SDR family NAD(P)-dependent oxidoreductase [Pseudomonadota bacterium]MDA1011660.1 SDR family NAD(P)-dependent oxidoreductase [Pseudomonadota bacterium]|tara:strand:+ start:19100 stop:19858 length:759 start_codon:yes stop_codon:yes gene_type:complete